MDVIYPNEEQIHGAVQKICAAGVQKPDGFFRFVRRMQGQIGLRQIFLGCYDVLLFLLSLALFLIFCLALTLETATVLHSRVYPSAFACAPLFYALALILCYAKERGSACFALKMSCKYNLLYLLAYRMFVFALGGLGLNTVFAMVCSARLDASFAQLFCLSFSALFLFAAAFIALLPRMRPVRAISLLALLWLALTALPALLFAEAFTAFLLRIPEAVYLLLSVCCVLLYLRFLARIPTNRRLRNYAHLA